MIDPVSGWGQMGLSTGFDVVVGVSSNNYNIKNKNKIPMDVELNIGFQSIQKVRILNFV